MTAKEGAISAPDREKIIASATDYVESWITGDADRMARCMHPELAKRSVRPEPQTGLCLVRTLTRDDMVGATAEGGGKEDAGPYKISILEAYGDMATVGLLSAAYVDYLHIARCGEAWLILNVLWQRRIGR